MGQLEDMAMFVRIVDAGSITKAAEQLDIAKSAVSRRLKNLESRLNCQLLSRTTRHSTLTDVGRQYYQQACGILNEVDRLNEHVSGVQTQLEGTLKLTAPLSFGLLHLNDIIHKFSQRHPQLSFELDFSDRQVDLIEQGYEMAIRIGELQDSSYQARRLMPIRYVLCASPAYLDNMGIPKTIEDLQDHYFLHYGRGKQNDLVLTDADGRKHQVSTTSKMRANNGDFLVSMALKGHGIAHLPTFLMVDALANKALIPLLPQYELATLNAYAVYPKSRFLSQRCRLLIDFIIEQIGETPYWNHLA